MFLLSPTSNICFLCANKGNFFAVFASVQLDSDFTRCLCLDQTKTSHCFHIRIFFRRWDCVSTVDMHICVWRFNHERILHNQFEKCFILKELDISVFVIHDFGVALISLGLYLIWFEFTTLFCIA